MVDKTGTLTEGKPRLTTVIAVPEQNQQELLRLAASLERGSEHPLAAAIVAAAQQKNLSLVEVHNFQSITGKGVTGTLDGRLTGLGNHQLLEVLGVDPSALGEQAEELRMDGQTVMFVAIDGRLAGLLCVADPIKATTQEAVQLLHQEGIQT